MALIKDDTTERYGMNEPTTNRTYFDTVTANLNDIAETWKGYWIESQLVFAALTILLGLDRPGNFYIKVFATCILFTQNKTTLFYLEVIFFSLLLYLLGLSSSYFIFIEMRLLSILLYLIYTDVLHFFKSSNVLA